MNVEKIFGTRVFDDSAMKKRLPEKTYQSLLRTRRLGQPLDPQIADVVACAMKEWAIEQGATHYSHWFQPMNNFTAGKHDAFLTTNGGQGEIAMEFSSKALIQGEADSSSFPSGGLRATFEARGYTTWDPTSPAFVRDGTLFIPTAFCSYNGEALDAKTPLLRSMKQLSKQGVRLLHALGKTDVSRITPMVGAEQEYFLVDYKLYDQRLDLKICGRTLFGAKPSKGQELDDHYYGAIKPRVAEFMHELDQELWKVGVPAKTEHNEVAPAQHEVAQVYSDANSSCDHNQLTMEFLKKVADRHGLVCLLHEKPFAGINGSGKHDNWSLATDTGENLLKPGKTPSQNAQFLLFLAAFIKGVDEYQDMLRCCVSYPGNDHRLGGNEAPPAIISVFLGDELTAILDSIISGQEYVDKAKRKLAIGVDTLPEIPQDTTDRNRTSPMAFTGNKFEFRMVGSSDSISSANVVLNTITAEAFKEACDVLESAEDFDLAVHDLIKEYASKHQRIVFNGNGYSDEWVAEAEKRGLPNIKSMVDAIPAYTAPESVAAFEKFGVFTKPELESRVEIEYETYAKTINIEAKAMIDIAGKQIIPAVIKYTTELGQSIATVKSACASADVSAQTDILTETSSLLAETQKALKSLETVTAKGTEMSEGKVQAVYYRDEVKSAMDALRAPVDKLEMIVDKDLWPMPSYGDLIFEV